MKMSNIMKNGKALFLAYDHGIEHGPLDFNELNIDPSYVINLAKKTKLPLILQKGIAEKYQVRNVSLILKLNGKTNIYQGEPYAAQLATVDEAIKLKAKAVGYTVYIGSKHEPRMFHEFEQVAREAHKKGLPVILWAYPRGEYVKKDTTKEILAYAARVALELGADIVKLKYSGNVRSFSWVVKAAGKVPVVVAGGMKVEVNDMIKQAYDIMHAGGSGLAIGRNVWQNDNPEQIIDALKDIIFNQKSVKVAMARLK